MLYVGLDIHSRHISICAQRFATAFRASVSTTAAHNADPPIY